MYEGELPNGTKIAMKDLNLSNKSVSDRQRIQRSFAAEVKTLGLIHHVNLVRLLGYCTEDEHHMLVYEFMANSSLDKWIFGDDPQRVLDWVTRVRIAIRIARGKGKHTRESHGAESAHLQPYAHKISCRMRYQDSVYAHGLQGEMR